MYILYTRISDMFLFLNIYLYIYKHKRINMIIAYVKIRPLYDPTPQ